jgi:hypothetical protein
VNAPPEMRTPPGKGGVGGKTGDVTSSAKASSPIPKKQAYHPPTPEQVAAADRFIMGPAAGDPRKAIARQVATIATMLVACDTLAAEAAEARIPAPGILEIREWCEYSLTETACRLAPRLDIKPDAIKDAVAGSVLAARSGDPEKYRAARDIEAAARKAA